MSAVTDFCPLNLEQLLKLPVLHSQAEKPDMTAHYKLRSGQAMWWVAEVAAVVNGEFTVLTEQNYSLAEDIVFFGAAEIACREMGSFSVGEWMDARVIVEVVEGFEPGSLLAISSEQRD